MFFLYIVDNGRVFAERFSDTRVKLTFRPLEQSDEGVYTCNVGPYRFLHQITIIEGNISFIYL